MQIALTIAGFDPSSGAGVTADLAVFAAHGLYGTSCLTAITVQSTLGVRAVHPLDPALVKHTLDVLCADMPPAGIKIGMLGNAAITHAVAVFLQTIRAARNIPVVLDPVIRSSSGAVLLEAEAVELLRTEILPLVTCITPNVADLAALLGRELNGPGEIEAGARELQRSAPALGLVVTGGDQQQPDDLVVAVGPEAVWLRGERVRTSSTHGTGCAYSSALLASLVDGRELPEAALRAKRYVEEALRRAPGLGRGTGPTLLLWPFISRSASQ